MRQESKDYVYTICQSLKSPYKEVATEHFYRAKAMIKKQIEGRAAR